jgi:hypothetical protein
LEKKKGTNTLPKKLVQAAQAKRKEMTELSFAKAFLSSLDSKPVRIPYDYVVDPATMPIRGPVRVALALPSSQISNKHKKQYIHGYMYIYICNVYI